MMHFESKQLSELLEFEYFFLMHTVSPTLRKAIARRKSNYYEFFMADTLSAKQERGEMLKSRVFLRNIAKERNIPWRMHIESAG